MANASGGKGDAYDARVEAVDNVGTGTELDRLYVLAADAEAAHERAKAKVEKQQGHLRVAEAALEAAAVELTAARKAVAKAEKGA